MSEHDKRTTDGDATARWLGESGELVSRYEAAMGEHVGRMATVNADLRRELAGARAKAGRLRALLVEIKRLTDAASEATMTRSTLDLAWRVGRIAERHMPVTMEEADAPGPGQEGGAFND